MAKKVKKLVINAKDERASENVNQVAYWSKLGITQSGGSRYESGRNIPKPVRMLMAIRSGKATVEQLRSGELATLI